MLYVGLDVHRRRTQVAALDEDGHELFNRNVPNDPEKLGDVLVGFEPGTPVVFEATYGWAWLAELLQEMGFEAHLAHPAACKAIASARLKNDKVDARTLAQLLRVDLLGEAWIAPRPVRELRLLLRHRAAVVKMRTTLKTRVRSVLADRGVAGVEALWDGPGRRWLATLELPDVEREIVDDLCSLLDAVEAIIARLERELRARAKPDPRVDALQHLPGVGLLTAMTLVAEIGDIARFDTARRLCSWAGLTPRVRNSDTKVRHGHITKMGPAAVRFVLGEAAHLAKIQPPFADAYESIRRRRGKQIATTAIARRLLAAAFYILKEVDTQLAADRCAG
ncbi:MAG: IS110 family transposase [Actinomycetota bacterium]|nr:IS110 family transposase [Actinomycetota bacterium]